MHYGFKFSTAIYTSFFTGKVPTNYAGHEINSDNLFYQFHTANMKMKFYGPRFPTMSLLGTPADQYFDVIDIPRENNLFEILRGNSASKVFNDALTNDLSLYFSTNLLDDRIHHTGKQDTSNYLLVTQLKEVLLTAKEFVDKNPEYLLIFNADHGGSLTGGNNEGQLHGPPDGGNEGWILFYNNNLQSLSNQLTWLDTVDVCGTIAKYFTNINIPMESIGQVKPNNDDLLHNYKVIKSNALQLKRLADLKNFPYDLKAFTTSMQEQDMANAISLMSDFIVSIKQPLINFKRFPVIELLYLGVLIICVQIILINNSNNNNNNLIKEIINLIKQEPFVFILFHVYLYLDLLFLKFDYWKKFEEIFTLYTFFFALLIFKSLFGYYIKSKSSTINDPQSSPFFSFNLKLSSIVSKMTFLYSIWFGCRVYWNYINVVLPITHLLNFLFFGIAIVILFQKHDSLLNFNFPFSYYLRKDIIYISILTLVLIYELSSNIFIMQFIYLLLLIDLIICSIYDPQLLVFPISMLHFIVSSDNERCYTLFIALPSYILLSSIIKELPSYDTTDTTENRHLKNLRLILLLVMVNFTYDSYVVMGGQFNMNVVVKAGNIGVVNVEDYPMLSAFLMAYHKLGYFFLLIAFLARVMIYDKLKQFNEFNSSSSQMYYNTEPIGIYFFHYMLLKSIVLLWTFHLAFWLYKDYLTCFIMTLITCLITALYGIILLVHNSNEDVKPIVTTLYEKFQNKRRQYM